MILARVALISSSVAGRALPRMARRLHQHRTFRYCRKMKNSMAGDVKESAASWSSTAASDLLSFALRSLRASRRASKRSADAIMEGDREDTCVGMREPAEASAYMGSSFVHREAADSAGGGGSRTWPTQQQPHGSKSASRAMRSQVARCDGCLPQAFTSQGKFCRQHSGASCQPYCSSSSVSMSLSLGCSGTRKSDLRSSQHWCSAQDVRTLRHMSTSHRQ